jgi:hypothetical protein
MKMNHKDSAGADPPIIVGGGGSTYIWVLKTLSPGTGELQPIPNPPDPDYEFPFNKALYNCYDVQVDLGRYKTHDGNNEGGFHPVKNRKKHGTRFYEETRRQ